MNEYYCPSKKPRWEHDKQCYYHGELTTCPYCGTKTIPVINATYKPLEQYDVNKSILDNDIANYGGRVNLSNPSDEEHDW